MASLPTTVVYHRVTGAADDAWTQDADGEFQLTAWEEREIVCVEASEIAEKTWNPNPDDVVEEDHSLLGTLVPLEGSGAIANTRATSAWMWRDADGRMWRDYASGRTLIECLAGEQRFEGARRVRNLVPYAQDISNAAWTPAGGTKSQNSFTETIVTGEHSLTSTATITVGRAYLVIAAVKSTGTIARNIGFKGLGLGTNRPEFNLSSGTIVNQGSQWAAGSTAITQVADGYFLVSSVGVAASALSPILSLIDPSTGSQSYTGSTSATLSVAYVACYDVTGLTNQSPHAYLSTNVLSAPYHGAGADGVKYYATLLDGTPIPASEISAVVEQQATNILLNSATLVTQSVTVTAQAYTLSFRGTGSVALSGVATGTLAGTGVDNRVQLTFTPTAGTLTLTVTGSVTTAVLRAGTIAGTYIPTAGSTVTRNADTLALSGYTLPAAGTLYFEAEAVDWAQVGGQLFGDGVEYIMKPITTMSGIEAFDGTNTAQGPAGTPSGRMRYAIRWGNGKMRISANGVLGAETNFDGSWNLAAYQIANGFPGTVRRLRTWTAPMNDARLAEITA